MSVVSLFLFILSLSVLSCSHAVVPGIDQRTDVRMRDLTVQPARTLPAPHQEPYSPPYNGPKSGNKQKNRGLGINNILPSRAFFHFWLNHEREQKRRTGRAQATHATTGCLFVVVQLGSCG
jgi:hypothetical protein